MRVTAAAGALEKDFRTFHTDLRQVVYDVPAWIARSELNLRLREQLHEAMRAELGVGP